MVALGSQYAGLMGTDDSLINAIENAAQQTERESGTFHCQMNIEVNLIQISQMLKISEAIGAVH